MPTTEPLDDVGDDAGGPLEPIAEFAAALVGGAEVSGQPPRATVPTPRATTTAPGASAAAGRAQTPAASPAGPRRFTSLRTPGVGLSGKRVAPGAETSRDAATAGTPHALRSASYPDADLVRAWKGFVAAHSGEHLLVNAMRAVTPTRLTGDKFRVAHSEVHIGLIGENIGRIRSEVADAVSNDHIEFVLEAVSEDSPLAWNDHELIRHIVEDNPQVGKFIETLKLSLL